MAVIASFVLGRNSASTLGGISSPLSTPADRARFLERHRSASAFIIGKESAAIENYSRSRQPIFVFTRSAETLHFSNPMMQQVAVAGNLAEVSRELELKFDGDIVVEAGARLLQALIKERVIDLLELTISPIEGDGNFLDLDWTLNQFSIIEEVVIDGTRLLQCRDKRDSPNS